MRLVLETPAGAWPAVSRFQGGLYPLDGRLLSLLSSLHVVEMHWPSGW